MDPTDYIGMAKKKIFARDAASEGILWNDYSTQKQIFTTWREIAIILHSNGYCAMVNEELGKKTNIIAHLDNPDWKLWSTTPHIYRVEFSAKIYNVPYLIMEALPTSGDCASLGYIKTDIIPPKDGRCTTTWLQHVCRTSLPNRDTERAPGGLPNKGKRAHMFTPKEMAGVLIDDGWIRSYEIGVAFRFNTKDTMSNIPILIWKELPK
jgi:hypothetical protein